MTRRSQRRLQVVDGHAILPRGSWLQERLEAAAILRDFRRWRRGLMTPEEAEAFEGDNPHLCRHWRTTVELYGEARRREALRAARLFLVLPMAQDVAWRRGFETPLGRRRTRRAEEEVGHGEGQGGAGQVPPVRQG